MERLVGSLKRVGPRSKVFIGEIRNGETTYIIDAFATATVLGYRVSGPGRTVCEGKMFRDAGYWHSTVKIGRVVWKIRAQRRGDEIEIEGIPQDELVASGVLPF